LRAGEVSARIVAVETYLPEQVLTNDMLAQDFDAWSADKIYEKTGIRERRVAAPDETATDLAIGAARKLLQSGACAPEDVDFIILCTQAPDHFLPTSACIVQDRLGLATRVGALDVNLGCSGFVYGLSLAAGLIAAGAARNVILLTADTYSKYIHARDRSVRTLFGDGAAATLISAAPPSDGARIGPFVFGTDGSGAGSLIVEAGGFRLPCTPDTALEETDRSGNVRSRNNLYMNGGAVLNFTLREVPRAVRDLEEKTGATLADYDRVILHQANKFMLDALQKKLGASDAQLARRYEEIGNTVSSTIPFVLEEELREKRCLPGTRHMLVGFGVGLSWASASIRY
jgi:3-oxoacyl-[acyl-carrier-protein] synthase-3